MWSIIRIILVVLNVLGAIAVFVVAAQNYGTRQNWAYTNFLHDMAVRGLPLDREELDSDNRKRRAAQDGQKRDPREVSSGREPGDLRLDGLIVSIF